MKIIQNLTKFLRQKFADSAIEISPVGEGAWSKAYIFKANNEDLVIRLSKTNENFLRDKIAFSFNSKNLRVPRIIELGKFSDYYYAISEYAKGEYFEYLNSSELKKLLPSLKQMFTGLLEVDLSKANGFGNWDDNSQGSHNSWREFLLSVKEDSKTSLIAGWSKNLQNSKLGFESFNNLYEELRLRVSSCPEVCHLIHSDLLNRNVLANDNKICAVLDWGSSKYGDPLYDLAWFQFYEPWYPEFTKIGLCQAITDHLKDIIDDTGHFEERLLCYKLHICLDSIAYNSFRKQWKEAKEVTEYTEKLLKIAGKV